MRSAPVAAPATPTALLQAAVAALGRGDAMAAAQALDAAAAQAPEHPDLLHLRGLLAQAQGELAAAADWIRRAARCAPATALYWSNLGAVLRDLDDLDGAEEALGRALALAPANPSALNHLGTVRARRRRWDAAAKAFAAAARAAPRCAEIWANLSQAQLRAGRATDALAAAELAHAYAPADPDALAARGLALAELDRGDEAERALAAATALAPRSAEAWHNLGFTRGRCGRTQDAIAAFDRALTLAPGQAKSRNSRGLCLLAAGEYARGWADYARRQRDGAPAPLPAALAGRRFVLRRDQGVGDDLFFMRFAPALRARGAEVAIDVDPRLHAMLARAGWRIAPEGEPLRSSDLPFLLGHAADAGSPPPLALTPEPARLAAARARLAAAGAGPWIAVAWRAGLAGYGHQLKALAPAVLGAALAPASGTVVVVQRAPAAADLAAFAAALGRTPVDASADNDDLEAMLALMAACDEHVAVSNTNLHLRAGAGKPTRVLVPFPAEWRWRARPDGRAAWFPDHPTYRQDADGNWSAALARLAADLART